MTYPSEIRQWNAESAKEDCARVLTSLSVGTPLPLPTPSDPVHLDEVALRQSKHSATVIPSLNQMVDTIEAWRQEDQKRSDGSGGDSAPRRSSCDSTISWTTDVGTPSLSEYASSRASSILSSPLPSPRTPQEGQLGFHSTVTHQPMVPLHSLEQPTKFRVRLAPGWGALPPRTVEASSTSPRSAATSITSPADSGRKPHNPLGPARGAGVFKKPHCNKKYADVYRDYILYKRDSKKMTWKEIEAAYEHDAPFLARYVARQSGGGGGGSGDDEDGSGAASSSASTREPSRGVQGLQGVYYRENLEIPVVDADGLLVFNADGTERTTSIKVREQSLHNGQKLDLIMRFPERVAANRYWFVDQADLELAIDLAARRDSQRMALGLPRWSQSQDKDKKGGRRGSLKN
ncbi:uncharacterized protein E0L32_012185 [Thyridium curvatum]|uniref:Uncharacterized protein n=1 Tax=Thyridium curvatum TaxID=1093900 RepID=A0A507BKT7_9PEZI|nr:uncharacterized protein E0L32_012185 [Thyridium curvatum]TPX17330.1 hypothetical protein E0L32_012185 [Thyridium curvatum]